MKFTFDRDSMIKVIAIAQDVITVKHPLSILSYILLEAENNTLVVKAMSSTTNVSATIPIDIEEEGNTTIYCDSFMNILSSLPSGDIEFQQKNNEVIIKPIAKRFTAKLKCQANDKFPEKSTFSDAPYFEIPSKDFKDMIKNTKFAVSTDKNRHFMTGCYLTQDENNLNMVSTDGRRLSCVSKNYPEIEVNSIPNAIIPTHILDCILKTAPDEGNIQISVVDKSIYFKYNNLEFASNLIEGQYPNYKKVIPSDNAFSVIINKADLEAALKHVSTMINKVNDRTLFKITPGELTISVPESENGSADEVIPCRYDGTPLWLAISFNFITTPIKAMSSENISIDFQTPYIQEGEDAAYINKAIVLREEPKTEAFHVIMPMTF